MLFKPWLNAVIVKYVLAGKLSDDLTFDVTFYADGTLLY